MPDCDTGDLGCCQVLLIFWRTCDHLDREQTVVGLVPQHGTSDQLQRKYRECVPPEKGSGSTMRRVLVSSLLRTGRRIASFITPPFRARASSPWPKASGLSSTSCRARRVPPPRT